LHPLRGHILRLRGLPGLRGSTAAMRASKAASWLGVIGAPLGRAQGVCCSGSILWLFPRSAMWSHSVHSATIRGEWV
jgi:hypothetical protein